MKTKLKKRKKKERTETKICVIVCFLRQSRKQGMFEFMHIQCLQYLLKVSNSDCSLWLLVRYIRHLELVAAFDVGANTSNMDRDVALPTTKKRSPASFPR